MIADKQNPPDVQGSTKPAAPASSPQTLGVQLDWRKNLTTTVFGNEWVQSLEDTPDRFQSSRIKDIDLRHALRNYLENTKSFKHNSHEENPSYSLEEIGQMIPADDLLYLSLFDLGLDRNDKLVLSYSWARSDLDKCRQGFLSSIGARQDITGPTADELWDWVCDGSPWESFRHRGKVSGKVKSELQRKNFRQELFNDHQKQGLERLSDSVRMRKSRVACEGSENH